MIYRLTKQELKNLKDNILHYYLKTFNQSELPTEIKNHLEEIKMNGWWLITHLSIEDNGKDNFKVYYNLLASDHYAFTVYYLIYD